MTKILTTLFLLVCLGAGATTFTEFYVDPIGSNLNGGSDTNAAATFSATGGNWTNNTSATTGTWFKSAQNLSGVSVGQWAALYTDGTSTNAQFVGYITAVSDANDTITIALNQNAGNNPSTVVAGMSIKVGGCWAGPAAGTMANGGGFPFGFLLHTATNAANVIPRANFRTNIYSINASCTHSLLGPCIFQGFAWTPGDQGKATIQGPAGGSSQNFALSAANNCLIDLIFDQNGSTGSGGNNGGVQISGAECFIQRCVFTRMNKIGVQNTASGAIFSECEAYGNNTTGTAAQSAMYMNGRAWVIRCLSHDNENSSGFNGAETVFYNCISDSNGGDGFNMFGTVVGGAINCDSFNNAGDGFDLTGASAAGVYLENCNAFLNTGFGINSSGSPIRNGAIYNCAFGTGTQTNALGNISGTGGLNEINSILYTANAAPWVDSTNGDFRIYSGALTRAAGRGVFTETAASYSGTVGYPDIGAAQAITNSTAASSGGGSYTFAQ